MHRRRFLAHALRLPAAVAALPLVGGLAAMTTADGQEVPAIESDMAPVYEEANVGWDEGGFLIDRWAGGVYQGYERLGPAVRSILVRNGDALRQLVAPWETRIPTVLRIAR